MADLVTQTGHTMSAANFIALMRSILTDGSLNGCGITASGANITIAAGRIVAGGAIVTLESTTVTATAAGELVLKIEMSAEPTASLIARAAVTLTKQDLTVTGNVYELQLATFGFTSGAVSGLSVKLTSAKPKETADNLPGIYVQQAQPSSPATGDLWFW